MNTLFVLLCFCAQMAAQSLQILPAPPTGGNTGKFQIMVVSPKTSGLAALQWSLEVSEGIAINAEQFVPGAAAKEAGKALTCGSTEKQAPRTWSCIVAGGDRSIPDGALATVQFTTTGAQQAKIRISKALGANAAGKPVAYSGTVATLPVGRPQK